MQKNHNQFVRCPENIQDLSGQKLNSYAVMLNGGMYSRKTIRYIKKTKRYSIVNHIDESRESLTERELMRSNIGRAMKQRGLIAIID